MAIKITKLAGLIEKYLQAEFLYSVNPNQETENRVVGLRNHLWQELTWLKNQRERELKRIDPEL